MPPGPIEGSWRPSPTAISFAPERSISSVSGSIRVWSTMPASSRITVVSGPTSSVPRFARATRASRVMVCPARAGLSAPSRSAVEPETAIPIISRPDLLLGACGGVDHDALPGAGGADQDGQTLGAGHRAQRLLLLGGQGRADPLGDFPASVLSRERRRPHGRRAAASAPARRSIACSWARTASVVIRPPSRVRMRRSPTIARRHRDRLVGTELPG